MAGSTEEKDDRLDIKQTSKRQLTALMAASIYPVYYERMARAYGDTSTTAHKAAAAAVGAANMIKKQLGLL